jgi:hypothetical protein
MKLGHFSKVLLTIFAISICFSFFPITNSDLGISNVETVYAQQEAAGTSPENSLVIGLTLLIQLTLLLKLQPVKVLLIGLQLRLPEPA